MAYGEETNPLGGSGILQKSINMWNQRRIADAQEEAARQKEMKADPQKQEQRPQRSEKPASEKGINAGMPALIRPGQPAAATALSGEARVGAGSGGSTGRITHFDPSKAPSYLDGIAQRYGINPDDFKRMAWIESRFDPSAKAGSSSAGGLFQFTDGTAKTYGLSNKFDGVSNADAAARLWNDNKAGLTKALGREPTAGELYLAHQQGLGGATALLKNPSAPATSLVGYKAVANNGGSAGMTGSQFASLWTGKFDSLRYSPTADGSTPRTTQDATNMSAPVQVASAPTTTNDASPPRPATPAASTPASTSTVTLPVSPTVAAPDGYYWDLGKAGDKPKLISRATGEDMAGKPAPGGGAVTPPATPVNAPPATTTPASTPAPASVPLPPKRSEEFGQHPQLEKDGPPAPTPAPAAQPQQESDIGRDIAGFFSSIFGDGKPIKDQYGRTWDSLEGWVDPKAKASAPAAESKSIASAESKQSSDSPLGDTFSGALNFMASIFG